MRLGVYFDGFTSMSDMLEAARGCRGCRAPRALWFAQHMGYREAFMCAAAVAGVTRKANVVPVAISPYLWPPLPVAMSIATINELAPGRAMLVVAVGNRLNLAESGIEPASRSKSCANMSRPCAACSPGNRLQLDGEITKLRGAHMNFEKGAAIPILVASTGPQMLQLAGEIGDGVVLSTGLTLSMTRQCLDHAAAARGARGAIPRPSAASGSSISPSRRTASRQEKRSCASSRFCFAARATPRT